MLDPFTILLIVVVVLALGGWGYGTYYAGPGPGAGPAPWVNPIGVIGTLLLLGLVIMLLTGWRIYVP